MSSPSPSTSDFSLQRTLSSKSTFPLDIVEQFQFSLYIFSTLFAAFPFSDNHKTINTIEAFTHLIPRDNIMTERSTLLSLTHTHSHRHTCPHSPYLFLSLSLSLYLSLLLFISISLLSIPVYFCLCLPLPPASLPPPPPTHTHLTRLLHIFPLGYMNQICFYSQHRAKMYLNLWLSFCIRSKCLKKTVMRKNGYFLPQH